MMERETREKYGVRDKKNRAWGGARSPKGIQGFSLLHRHIYIYIHSHIYIYTYIYVCTRVESISSGVESEKKQKANSSRIPCDGAADEAKALPQLEETNLTHLWTPFNRQQEEKKMSPRRERKRTIKGRPGEAPNSGASPDEPFSGVVETQLFMWRDGTTRRKTLWKGPRLRWKRRDERGAGLLSPQREGRRGGASLPTGSLDAICEIYASEQKLNTTTKRDGGHICELHFSFFFFGFIVARK